MNTARFKKSASAVLVPESRSEKGFWKALSWQRNGERKQPASRVSLQAALSLCSVGLTNSQDVEVTLRKKTHAHYIITWESLIS